MKKETWPSKIRCYHYFLSSLSNLCLGLLLYDKGKRVALYHSLLDIRKLSYNLACQALLYGWHSWSVFPYFTLVFIQVCVLAGNGFCKCKVCSYRSQNSLQIPTICLNPQKYLSWKASSLVLTTLGLFEVLVLLGIYPVFRDSLASSTMSSEWLT